MPMVLRSRRSIRSSEEDEVKLLDRTRRRSTRLHSNKATYEVGILLLSFSASSSSTAENFTVGHVASSSTSAARR